MVPTTEASEELAAESAVMLPDSNTTATANGSPPPDESLASYNWIYIAAGIILAAGIYSFLLVVIRLGVQIASLLWQMGAGSQFAPEIKQITGTLIGGPIAVVFTGGLLGMIGMIWAAVITVLTTPLVFGVVRSLDLRGRPVMFGATWGGFVGYAAALPLAVPLANEFGMPANDVMAYVIGFAIGPGLATIVGQLGGAWGAKRSERASWWYERAAAKARVEKLGAFLSGAPQPSASPAVPPPQKLQFSLRQMLWITVWFSVLLTLIRLCGIPFEFILPALAGWLVYQTATFYLGSRLFSALGKKWTGPQTGLAGRIL
jgi:hypothetical protein